MTITASTATIGESLRRKAQYLLEEIKTALEGGEGTAWLATSEASLLNHTILLLDKIERGDELGEGDYATLAREGFAQYDSPDWGQNKAEIDAV